MLAEEDTDGDKNITIHDTYVQGSNRGDQRFWLIAMDGTRYEVDGTYYLSNLLEELALKQRAGLEVAPIDFELILEQPVHRTRAVLETCLGIIAQEGSIRTALPAC